MRGIEHHQVRIRAGLDGPLAREQAEQFRRLRTGAVHQRMQIQFPGLHAVSV